MFPNMDFIRELLADIVTAVGTKQWDSAKANLTVLGDQIASAIRGGKNDVVRQVYDAVERGFSNLLTRNGPDETLYDERSVIGEIGAYIRLLDVTLRREMPVTDALAKLPASSIHRKVIEALEAVDLGLSGRALAEKVNVSEEHIARKILPELRALGLVESERIGKSTINTLDPDARVALLLNSEPHSEMGREVSTKRVHGDKAALPVHAHAA
jgi:hypothetical protein